MPPWNTVPGPGEAWGEVPEPTVPPSWEQIPGGNESLILLESGGLLIQEQGTGDGGFVLEETGNKWTEVEV